LEIVENVFRRDECQTNNKIKKHISHYYFTSVRELEGFCITIIAQAKINNINLDDMKVEKFNMLYRKTINNF